MESLDLVVETTHENKNKLLNKIWHESKAFWGIAAPAIITMVAQYSFEFVTLAFVGHLGDLQLAAVAVVQNVLVGFIQGVMLGLGSALETLCGQTVGAGQNEMLGVYMQTSCIITLITAVLLTPIYIFTSLVLRLLHQSKNISELAGKYAIWVIPQLFAHALNFPVQKFLQAQSKIWVMTIMSLLVLAFHVFLNWILVVKLEKGLLGAAIAENVSWWLLVSAQIAYVVSGFFPESWTGFSLSAFKYLYGFLKLSIASAIMECLEIWYYTIVILLVGLLKNPEVAVDAVSICMDLETWVLMIALGFNAAISVRVSNELGANRPKHAKFSLVVAVVTSMLFGLLFAVAILATKSNLPKMFSNRKEVIKYTSKLDYFLAATIFLNSIQSVFHGVAIGAGWQVSVAFINIGCYYAVGLPLGSLLGYKFSFGLEGIWTGMLAGCMLQTAILLAKVCRANWTKEALLAKERVVTLPLHQQNLNA